MTGFRRAMTKAKTASKSMSAEKKVFNIELFEEEYFDLLKNDPEHWATEFEFHDWKYVDPENIRGKAHVAMLSAKQKIRELLEEINKQEAIIGTSKRVIQKFNRYIQNEKSNRRGRPERPEHREEIVKEFMKKWVASLKDALEVRSCGEQGGLAKMVSSTLERNWRRWLNGDSIPSYATFEMLLDSKITAGKYSGESLRDVPVTPTHNQMLILLQFI